MRVQKIHTLNQRSLFQIACPSGGEKKVLLLLGFINMDQVGSKSKKLLNTQSGKKCKAKFEFLCILNVDLKGKKTEKIHDYHLKTRTFENLHKFQNEGSFLNQMNNQHPFNRPFLNLSARRTPYIVKEPIWSTHLEVMRSAFTSLWRAYKYTNFFLETVKNLKSAS